MLNLLEYALNDNPEHSVTQGGCVLAEFTVLTPFPHTRAYEELKRQNRILTYDWNEYSADKVVFQPKQMAPERLQELLSYAWDTFYQVTPRN
jgi:hypothetical protein